jgi:hypothetical protein
MELKEVKYVSMVVLLGSNLLMTIIAICLHKFILQRNGNVLSITQRVISCLTSGILLGKLIIFLVYSFSNHILGTLFMLILPNSLAIVAHQYHTANMGYIIIGLGFFLICVIDELIKMYDLYLSNKQPKTEKEQLINSSTTSNHDSHLTRIITLVFALGVHYFFSIKS